MPDEPTARITDVVPGSVEIPRTELRVGDTVFDAVGGQHQVTRVRHYRSRTSAQHSGRWGFYLEEGETITVLR